jgi:lipoprotein-releasing system permease protein
MTLRLFKAYFLSKKSGSTVKMMAWLSLSAMAIGVFGLILVLSIMAGFNDNIRDRLLSYEPHMVVYSSKNKMSEIKKVLKNNNIKFDDVYKFESQDVIIRSSNGSFQGAEARGFAPERISEVIKTNLIRLDGRQTLEKNELIFNFDLAKSLRALEGDYIDVIAPATLLQPLGSDMKIASFQLAGVFFTQLTSSKNANTVIYSLDSLVTPESKGLKRGYEILLDNPLDTVRAKKIMMKHNFKDVQTWQERNSSLLFALKLERFALGFFLVMSVLITSFSMMTVLLLLLHQKRQEIGILMTMGLSKIRVRLIFGSIGLLLSSIGVLLGFVPGFLLAKYIEMSPLKIMPDVYQDPYLPARVDLPLISLVLFVCVVICILSLIIPLFNISKLSPSAALKSISN